MGYFEMSDKTIWILCILAVICIVIFFLIGGIGCLSASSMTGSETMAKLKAEQQSSQETTSVDKVRLAIAPTIITLTDGTIISIGGGEAETGSQTVQQSDQLSDLSAKISAQTEASSQASINLTYLLLGLGIFVILLVIFELYRIKKGIF